MCRRSGQQGGRQNAGREAGGPGVSEIIDINRPGQPYEELKVSHPADHTRAFLKIQDGCNQFCSYLHYPLRQGKDPQQEAGRRGGGGQRNW